MASADTRNQAQNRNRSGDGRAQGRFRYETEDTLQLLNAEATIWTTYFKKDLTSVADMESSLMPDGLLSKLSKSEQDALFTFLGSLN